MRKWTGIAAILLAACGGNGQHQMPPTDVSVAQVVQRSITEWDDYSGQIEAVESAEIRPRVTGHLRRVHFHEGGLVEKGALLFTIDDREYAAAADAARADAARAEARVALSKQDLQRAERLIGERAISQGELDQRRMEAQQADADVLAARARVAQAELNLGFTRVTAPFAGRVGAALVKPGNVVTPNETLLTTLVSVDPVYVSFTGDERAYLRYQELARSGRARKFARRAQSGARRPRQRGRIPARRRGRLRRQRPEPLHRHDPRPRRAGEPGRRLHARPVRARAPARRLAVECVPDPRAGGADRPGPALRLRPRQGQCRGAPRRHARGAHRRAARRRIRPEARRQGDRQRHDQDLLPGPDRESPRRADGPAQPAGAGAGTAAPK